MQIKILVGFDISDEPIYEILPGFSLPVALTYFQLAVERNGLIVSIYLNGQLMGFATQTLAYEFEDLIRCWSTYYAQYRWTVGEARYKGPFTVPSGLFPIS